MLWAQHGTRGLRAAYPRARLSSGRGGEGRGGRGGGGPGEEESLTPDSVTTGCALLALRMAAPRSLAAAVRTRAPTLSVVEERGTCENRKLDADSI